MITTIKELLSWVEGESQEIDSNLMNNLVILSLAIDGSVSITGFSEGQLQSENTKKGRDAVVDYIVADWSTKM